MALSFPLKTQGSWASEMHKQVANDELHAFYHFQTFASSITNFRYPPFVLKMSTIGEGISAIICNMLPPILIITKKYKFPCSAVNVHITIRFVYFISCQTYGWFPVWWASLHWRPYGKCHGEETFVQWIWQIRFYRHVNQNFRRKRPISLIKRTTRTRFC